MASAKLKAKSRARPKRLVICLSSDKTPAAPELRQVEERVRDMATATRVSKVKRALAVHATKAWPTGKFSRADAYGE